MERKDMSENIKAAEKVIKSVKENSYKQGYEKGYKQGRKGAQDEINRLREYIARQSEEEYD